MLGLDPANLRVVCPWVGGGFGPKAAGYVEHLVAAAAALTLNRPVKWADAGPRTWSRSCTAATS